MNTADILDKAADLIDVYGLHKGWYFGSDGSCCMRGAVILAADPAYPLLTEEQALADKPNIPWDADVAIRALDRYVARKGLGWDAVMWQDDENRTKEEVVSTLRAAAQAARASDADR